MNISIIEKFSKVQINATKLNYLQVLVRISKQGDSYNS